MTAFMLLNASAALPVTAAQPGIADGYTIVDTCYSPELDMYVAAAKNLSSQITPGVLLYSQTGEEWSVGRNINSMTHYAGKYTAQNVVWWEKEHIFVAIADNNVLTSQDGMAWVINSDLSGKSNSIVQTNGDALVINSRKTLRVFDDLLTPQIEMLASNSDIYGKALGVTDTEPYTYVIFDKSAAYVFSPKPEEAVLTEEAQFSDSICEEIEETAKDIGDICEEDEIFFGLGEDKLNLKAVSINNLTDNPVDAVYIPSSDAWAVIDGGSGLKLFDRATNKMSVLKTLTLTDAGSASESISAAAVGSGYIMVGAQNGNLYAAPETAAAVAEGEPVWERLEPGEGTERISGKIYSISSVNENTFFFATQKDTYTAVKTEEGWKYYDGLTSKLTSGGVTRIEIPESGSSETEIIPQSLTYAGRPSINKIDSVSLLCDLPEGISAQDIDGGIKIITNSTVSAHHKLTFEALAQNGQRLIFDVDIVDEDHVDVDGFEELATPQSGEGDKQYKYSAVVIGTDGKAMSRQAVMNVVSMPLGVEFDEESGMFTVHENAVEGDIILEIYSNGKPENVITKTIHVGKSHPAFIEIVSGASALRIPDTGTQTAQYAAVVYDQVMKEITDAQISWSVEAKSISTMSDIGINAQKGELSVGAPAYAGTIYVKAAAKTDSSVNAVKEVTLNYTDKRMAAEDLKALDIDTENPIENNMELKTEGGYGSTITWKSSDETLLLSDGTVIRPSREDKKVTLTAAAALNGKRAEQKFELTIKKADNLCKNGDFADGTSMGWLPEGGSVLNVLPEEGKNVLNVSGTGAYQEFTFTNNSSYAVEIEAKAKAGAVISLVSSVNGRFAQISCDGTYKVQKTTIDYRKQKDSFEEKISVQCSPEVTISSMKIYEITLELEKVTTAVNTAAYSKSQSDIDKAKALLEDFYDLPVRAQLYERLNSINTSASGGTGGGGGGGGAVSRPGSVAPSGTASNVNNVSSPAKQEDNYDDILDTYLLKFKDMKNHWAREDVEYMGALNIIDGNDAGEFVPDSNISRAEFAALITRTMGLEETPYENSFFDVVSEDWYSGYVQTVRSNDFMNGYDGLFNPNTAISREEIAKVIVEAYNSRTQTKLQQGKALYFNDIDDISYWAYDYVAEAAELGFVNGVTDELFAPKSPATRAQAAVMLKRVYDKLNPAD